MKNLPLKLIEVAGLDISANSGNVHKDLHQYIAFIRSRQVKRTHRDNYLSKADLNRVAKLMSQPGVMDELKEMETSRWINFIEMLAFKLSFATYDTEGEYMGYSSMEPSFPNNYIQFNPSHYQDFVQLSSQAQEQRVLDTLVNDYNYENHELMRTSALGSLDRFTGRGCATGVLPNLNFSQVRKFLFQLLAQCQPNIWYSTASLIQYLKVNHPFFLIPEKPAFRYPKEETDRYCNFYETNKNKWQEKVITKDMPNAFERVEGRYIERFLEAIPLTLGYVDVAYGESEIEENQQPSLHELKAFRIKPRFLRLMNNQILPAKTTVQPNFEIQVEADIYPVYIINQLKDIGKVISEDTVILIKLEKQKVVAKLATDADFNVTELLKKLSNKKIPENVAIELQEWASHAEVFTLFEGCALLEGKSNLPNIAQFCVDKISSKLSIVHSQENLFAQLEVAGAVPIMVKHKSKSLQTLPKESNTLFPKAITKEKITSKPKKMILKREIKTTLHFPSKEALSLFHNELLSTQCIVELNHIARTISYRKNNEKEIKQVIQSLQKVYKIAIEDVEKV